MEINPKALCDKDFLAFLCNEEISPDTTTAATIRTGTLELLAKLRTEAEVEVERLLALIDRIDGDCDLEPSLGFVSTGQVIDAEEEHDGREPDNDDEPCAGDERELDCDTFEGSDDEDREPDDDSEDCGYVLNRADVALRQKLRAARHKPSTSVGRMFEPHERYALADGTIIMGEAQ